MVDDAGRRFDLIKTDLRDAFLPVAHMERANLVEAHLDRAFLTGAYLEGAVELTQEHLAQAFGATKVADELRPAH